MFARIFNFLGYCLFGVFMARCVLRMINGQVLAGAVMLALSIGALIAWCWYKRPVTWGKIMLESAVKGYDPEQARKVVAEFSEEDKKEFARSAELLWLALCEGNTRGAELLLELGVDINAPLPPYASETTVLQTFCIEPAPDMDAIRFLLRHGANPDAGLSFPPMINALAWGNEDLVQLLLSHGATPGGMGMDINPSGNTPLQSLCSIRCEEDKALVVSRIRELLEAGADVNALSTAGHTPLDVALEVKGDEDKPMDAQNPIMPVLEDVVSLLKQHGALRGCQLRCPRPRFCGRVLLGEPLPDVNLLRDWCKDEPTARVDSVNHAWMGEGLGALADDASLSEAEKRAILGHNCYIEISLEEPGAVPFELAKRYVRLLCHAAQAPGCVGIDFGRMLMPARYAAELAQHPEYSLPFIVPVRPDRQDEGLFCFRTEGMEDLGMLEVVCRDANPEAALTTLQECIIPMLAQYGTCLEHDHRAFISPKLSLVATCEPRGSQGSMVLCITLDHTHYRD